MRSEHILRSRRAESLLLDWMDGEQKELYRARRYFYVVSCVRKVYALFDGFQVVSMYEARPSCSYHVYTADLRTGERFPAADSILTQMLFLQTNPEYLLNKACQNPPYDLPAGLETGVGCPPMARDSVPRPINHL